MRHSKYFWILKALLKALWARSPLGVEVKLSEGDEGEILVKSPKMFSRHVWFLQLQASAFGLTVM